MSSTTLKANRDVENTVKTERERQEIIDSTEPRYTIDKTISDNVLESVEDFFIIADSERKAYKDYLVQQSNEETKTDESFESQKLSTFLVNEADVEGGGGGGG